MTGISSVVFSYTLSQWFRRRLGLALGITLAGFGASGFGVPGIVYLLDLIGLRATFVTCGITALVLGIILAYFLRNRPEDIGSTPDGLSESETEPAPESFESESPNTIAQSGDYTLREAVSTPAFWVLVYVGITFNISVMMVITHVMPYLENVGYDRHLASLVAMMIPVLSIVGRLGIGWASDFGHRKALFIIGVTFQAVAVLLFIYARLSFLLIPFVILFGTTYGGNVVLRLIMVREYYGRAYVGSITGIFLGLTTVFSLFGPLLGGIIFDKTGSYDLAWIINGALLAIGVPLMLRMKNPLESRRK